MYPVRKGFSKSTRLVFARLDTEIPFDRKAIDEMKRHKLIISVKENPFLRNRFKATKKRYTNVYAIPFRRPGENFEEFHGRSVHAKVEANKSYVFKGVGATGEVGFRFDSSETLPERQFKGGARRETIAQAIHMLSQLERAFQKAKGEKDALVVWAGETHGITDLPVIKHAAVFRPLQFTTLRLEDLSKPLRSPVTRENFKKLGLGKFYSEARVHVYSAHEPARILEPGRRYLSGFMREAEKLSKSGVPKYHPNDYLKRFITRGLLLIHVAHSRGITLSSHGGSVLNAQNAGPLEFFDFDVAGKWSSKKDFEKYRDRDYAILATAVQALSHKLSSLPPAEVSYRETYLPIVAALEAARNSKLSSKEKFDIFNQKVDEIAAGAQKLAGLVHKAITERKVQTST